MDGILDLIRSAPDSPQGLLEFVTSLLLARASARRREMALRAATQWAARCLGLELARQGVRCNVVSPGSTQTPMLERMLGDGSARVPET